MVQELVDALKAAGARHISFNPFTEALLTRKLLAVAETEGIPLAKAQAESLAVRAAGDLSAAINSLQLSTRSQPKSALPRANAGKPSKKVDCFLLKHLEMAQTELFQTCLCRADREAWLALAGLASKCGVSPVSHDMHCSGSLPFVMSIEPATILADWG